MLKEAIDQWTQLQQRSETDTLWATLAQKELVRLKERLAALEASYAVQSASINTPRVAPPTTPTTNDSTSAAPQVTIAEPIDKAAPAFNQKFVEIVSAEAPQMGSGDNYAYMRILSVEIRTLPAGNNIRGEDIVVRMQFYDQDRQTRRIYPSEIYVPRKEFTLSGPIPAGKIHSITCPYTVPLEFRNKQYDRDKRNLIYYGFTVEVFYAGHLQDYNAKPLSLASRIRK